MFQLDGSSTLDADVASLESKHIQWPRIYNTQIGYTSRIQHYCDAENSFPITSEASLSMLLIGKMFEQV